jgi:hypothetical protein
MSLLSERLLRGVDYTRVQQTRKDNYSVYERAFRSINQLTLPPLQDATPFCYPLMLDRELEKELLFEQGIFIPTFWKDVLKRGESGYEFEKLLARRMLPLPLDHRYKADDCEMVIHAIKGML